MEIWRYMVNLPFYWDIGFSGKLKSKICDGISLTVYGNLALYGKFTLLLFKASFNTKRFKNFYSMKTCLDLNNTVDSGIYYLEDNLK